MNAYEELVERLVREVTAELGRRTAAPAASTSAKSATVIDHKVITADLLERSVNGDRNIVIGSHSILTPSAKDYLRQRKITWNVASRSNAAQSKQGGTARWLAIVVQSTPAVTTVFEHHAADWKQHRAADTAEAAGAAISAICRGDADGVVVFSEQPEAVACRANRNANLRAATVNDILETKAAQQSIGANVFCCDPKQKPFFELRNILQTVTAGSTNPPAGWRE